MQQEPPQNNQATEPENQNQSAPPFTSLAPLPPLNPVPPPPPPGTNTQPPKKNRDYIGLPPTIEAAFPKLGNRKGYEKTIKEYHELRQTTINAKNTSTPTIKLQQFTGLYLKFSTIAPGCTKRNIQRKAKILAFMLRFVYKNILTNIDNIPYKWINIHKNLNTLKKEILTRIDPEIDNKYVKAYTGDIDKFNMINYIIYSFRPDRQSWFFKYATRLRDKLKQADENLKKFNDILSKISLDDTPEKLQVLANYLSTYNSLYCGLPTHPYSIALNKYASFKQSKQSLSRLALFLHDCLEIVNLQAPTLPQIQKINELIIKSKEFVDDYGKSLCDTALEIIPPTNQAVAFFPPPLPQDLEQLITNFNRLNLKNEDEEEEEDDENTLQNELKTLFTPKPENRDYKIISEKLITLNRQPLNRQHKKIILSLILKTAKEAESKKRKRDITDEEENPKPTKMMKI